MGQENNGRDKNSIHVIDEGIGVRGDLEGKGRLYIYGRVEGNVRAGEELLVGGKAHVRGNFSSRVIHVEGIVEGDLEASEKIFLKAGARIVGNIHTPILIIEKGARYRGEIDMGLSYTSKEKEQSKPMAPRTSLFSRALEPEHEEVEVVVERTEKPVGLISSPPKTV
ncbi:MAG: polymer-forming cytoskeletal protein [Deltaproteobacteria bacterium]|nr:polymer-forming cytoskeletal protein [Deltaproteobacteria bacterium]